MTETPVAWTARQAPELRTVARKARALVKAAFPDFVEYVHYGVIKYGRTTALRDWLVYISGQRDHLNLGFVQGLGAAVPDPTGLIEGSGRAMRHMKLRTVADAERPGVRAILRAAAKVKPEQLAQSRRARRPASPSRDAGRGRFMSRAVASKASTGSSRAGARSRIAP